MLTEGMVRASLAEIPYPGLSRDIVSLGLVRSVAVRNDRVHVSLTLASPREDVPDRLREVIRERLARAIRHVLPGRCERERHVDPIVPHGDGTDQPQRDDVPAEAGIGDLRQRRAHHLLGQHHPSIPYEQQAAPAGM